MKAKKAMPGNLGFLFKVHILNFLKSHLTFSINKQLILFVL